jgi:hypothetical protein
VLVKLTTTGEPKLIVTIPKCIPNGNYLLRIEQVGLRSASVPRDAQFHISCAQLSISGSSSVHPSPLVDLLGERVASEPDLQINIYYPVPTSYHDPGPEPSYAEFMGLVTARI